MFVSKPKNQAANPGKQGPKDYPHYMLKGDREDVADLIVFIDSLYKNDDYHIIQFPIARELLPGIVKELQNELGTKYNVNI